MSLPLQLPKNIVDLQNVSLDEIHYVYLAYSIFPIIDFYIVTVFFLNPRGSEADHVCLLRPCIIFQILCKQYDKLHFV